MKVLMINVSCGVGSTGRICTDFASLLEDHGHETVIAYGRSCIDNYKAKSQKIGKAFGIYIHAFLSRIFDCSGLCSTYSTKRFIKWIKEYDPDIIHLHNIHGYYLNVPILFKYLKKANKPVVWTMHDSWSFTGHTPFCDSIDCSKWVTGCKKCQLKRKYPATLIDNSFNNWKWKKRYLTGIPNLTIVTPSVWMSKMIKSSFLSEYPIEIINNGIDTSIFNYRENNIRSSLGLDNKMIILGVASVWDDMKGLSDFVKLSSMLDDSYQIVLIGLEKKQINKLPKNIIGIERTNNAEELAEYYSAADLFVNLSYCDNYPTTNLEARACGTKVLTYDTGGSPESAGEDSIIVKKGDISSVVYEIKNIKIKKNNNDTIQNKKVDYRITSKLYMELINKILNI